MTTAGTNELASLESNVDLLRISQARDVAVAIAELLATDRVYARIALLGEWHVEFPKATSQLLNVVARTPETAGELATTVIGCAVLDRSSIDDVLAAAFSKLTGALRDAAADRPGVRLRVGIPDGVGYVSVPRPNASWLWPSGKTFPDPETVAGVQARLNYLGLGAGAVTGEWNELTRIALSRWQVLNGFEAMDEFDEESAEYLALATPDSPR